jgi:hypothetical protein
MKQIGWVSLGLLIGLLSSCTAKPTAQEQQKESEALKNQVVDTLYQNFSFSEIEIYLYHMQAISDPEMSQFSDQVCESIRRGQSFRTIRYELMEQGKLDDKAMIYAMIAIATEQSRCPETSLPKAQWQRSLLALKERLNGGETLSRPSQDTKDN